jgi:hypothetical protein
MVKGRPYQQILELMHKRQATVIVPASVAQWLDLKEKKVTEILEHWKTLGLVRAAGEYPFAYKPSKKHKADIEYFFDQWQNPAWRTKIIAGLMARE